MTNCSHFVVPCIKSLCSKSLVIVRAGTGSFWYSSRRLLFVLLEWRNVKQSCHFSLVWSWSSRGFRVYRRSERVRDCRGCFQGGSGGAVVGTRTLLLQLGLVREPRLSCSENFLSEEKNKAITKVTVRIYGKLLCFCFFFRRHSWTIEKFWVHQNSYGISPGILTTKFRRLSKLIKMINIDSNK